MPGPAAAAARLRAAAPEARFFGGRRFGGGALRGARDLGAMIPLTLAVPTMPWPGSGSHAEGCFFKGADGPGHKWPWSGQPDAAPDLGRRHPGGAQFAQPGGLGRLGEFSALTIED
jgi:hypothetical protein